MEGHDLIESASAICDQKKCCKQTAADEAGYRQKGWPDVDDLSFRIDERLDDAAKAKAPDDDLDQDHQDRTSKAAHPSLHNCSNITYRRLNITPLTSLSSRPELNTNPEIFPLSSRVKAKLISPPGRVTASAYKPTSRFSRVSEI